MDYREKLSRQYYRILKDRIKPPSFLELSVEEYVEAQKDLATFRPSSNPYTDPYYFEFLGVPVIPLTMSLSEYFKMLKDR